jgi:DNA-binding response OmpR family regulator
MNFASYRILSEVKTLATILVVEDDVIIRQVITEFLKEANYLVLEAGDGEEALNKFKDKEIIDLVLLDFMLPKKSGLEVLENIRQFSDVPIVMLTAVSDDYTQLACFSHLINDYIIKPFSPMIVLKRIENVFRLVGLTTIRRAGELEVDSENKTVSYKQADIPVTKKEYQILEILVKRKGSLVTRENLMYSIWGFLEVDSRLLDNHIRNIRKKLPDLPLKTIIGRGFQLEVDE